MFKPGNLEPQSVIGSSKKPSASKDDLVGGSVSGEKISNITQEPLAYDIEQQLENLIHVDGASSDVYNAHEVFDRDRLISLASIDFETSELEELLDLFDANIFDQKLDRTLLQEIYSRANLEKLGPQLEKLESEISLARNRLAAARTLHQIIRNTERSLINPERKKRIQQIFNQLTRERKENPLVKISDDLDIDVFAALEEITLIPKDFLEHLPPTYLYMQLCEELKQNFYEGGPANIFLSTHPTNSSRRKHFGTVKINEGELAKLWELYSDQSGRKAVNQVGLSKSNTRSDYVYGNKPAGRIFRGGYQPQSASGGFAAIAAICTMLANEYRCSAGIGRLGGNKIAFKYGLAASKARPFQSMFGGQNVNFIYKNFGIPGSLQSLGIVGKEGQLQSNASSATNKVALFDGYINALGTTGGTNKVKYMDVRTAFFKDVKHNPTNNKLDVLDQVIAKGEQSFGELNDLLTEATGAEEELNLLTPQGLFIRVLEDFCGLIKYKGYEGDEVARAEQLSGVHLLNLTHPFYSDSQNSWHGVLKHRLNVYIARLLSRRREATGVIVDKQVRLSPKEFSGEFKANLEEIGFDRRVIAETMIAFSNKTQMYGHNTIGGASFANILTDPNQFVSKYYQDNFKDTTLNKKFNKAAILSGEDFIDVNRDIDGAEGFLRIIANIFEDMEKEAMKLAGDGSYVNEQRLTNNSGLDAALTTAMILECFCKLSRQFTDTHFLLGANIDAAEESATVATSAEEGADNLKDLSYLQYGDYVETLRAIKDTENAHDHIHGGASEQFIENFSNTATGANLKEYYTAAADYLHFRGMQGTDLPNIYDVTGRSHAVDELLEMAGFGNALSVPQLEKQAEKVVKEFGGASSFVTHIATMLRNRGAHAFAAARHVLLYNEGDDAGRQTLLEVIAAAKDGDLDQLFGDPNDPEGTFLAGGGFLPYGANMTAHSHDYKPQHLIDAIRRTAVADVAHTRMFDACRAMFIHLQESTAELSRAAAALRASSPTGIVHRGTQIEDPNAQLQALVRLSKTQSGRKLINSFSSRQTELVEKRLQLLEAADETTAYMIDQMRPETEAAIRMYLDQYDVRSTKKGKFLFLGIPAGKLEDLIYNKNAEQISIEGYDSTRFTSVLDESFEDAELEIRIYPLDEINPGIKYKKPRYVFPLNIDIDEAGIAIAFESENQPKTFNELARRCEYKIDSPLTTEVVRKLGDDLTAKYSLGSLKNILSSFLIKKFAQVTYGMNFDSDELILSDVEQTSSNFPDPNRSSTALGLMEDLGSVFLPLAGNDVNPTPLIKKLFENPHRTRDLNFPVPSNVTKFFDEFVKKQDLGTSNMDYRVNAELLLSLFCTKPFYADSIEGHVQKPSEFDYVFALYINDKNCAINIQETNKLAAGTAALKDLKQYGENIFSLKTVRAEANIKNRKTGEIL